MAYLPVRIWFCICSGRPEAGDGGLRLHASFNGYAGVGKALDGELAQLVPQADLTSAQTDAVIPFRDRAFPLGSHLLKAEFRRSPRHPLQASRVGSRYSGWNRVGHEIGVLFNEAWPTPSVE